MIAVTFALPDESGVFLKSLFELRQLTRGPLPVYLGRLGTLDIAVLHTGVGLEAVRSRVPGFLGAHRPELLISSGFAGGLDPLLDAGAIFVADNYSSPVLLDSTRLFFRSDPSVFFGSLISHSTPVESIVSKRSLALETGAMAVDMETSALLMACTSRAIPFLSLRAISDTASQKLPVPFSIWFDLAEQKARPLQLLLYLAAHPSVIPAFILFIRSVFRAKNNLSSRLLKLIGHFEETGFIHKHD